MKTGIKKTGNIRVDDMSIRLMNCAKDDVLLIIRNYIRSLMKENLDLENTGIIDNKTAEERNNSLQKVYELSTSLIVESFELYEEGEL